VALGVGWVVATLREGKPTTTLSQRDVLGSSQRDVLGLRAERSRSPVGEGVRWRSLPRESRHLLKESHTLSGKLHPAKFINSGIYA
jgi:hypothetical protein